MSEHRRHMEQVTDMGEGVLRCRDVWGRASRDEV